MYKSKCSYFSEDNEKPFSFGLQTLRSLKVGVSSRAFTHAGGAGITVRCSFPSYKTTYSLQCVINMEKHHLVLGKTDREEIPFVGSGSAVAGDQ